MSLPVYSSRFGLWQHQTGLVNLLNETGDLWVVRYMHAYNGNDLEVVTLAVADYKTGGIFWAPNTSLAPGSWDDAWEGRVVIPPSSGADDQGISWQTNGFPIDLYIGGYTLPSSL